MCRVRMKTQGGGDGWRVVFFSPPLPSQFFGMPPAPFLAYIIFLYSQHSHKQLLRSITEQVPDTWVWCKQGSHQPSCRLQGKMLVHHIRKGAASSWHWWMLAAEDAPGEQLLSGSGMLELEMMYQCVQTSDHLSHKGHIFFWWVESEMFIINHENPFLLSKELQ